MKIHFLLLLSMIYSQGVAATLASDPENDVINSNLSRDFVTNTNAWSHAYIDVCWQPQTLPEGETQADWDTAKHWAKTAVANSWMRYSNLEFVGWDACTSQSTGLRLSVADAQPVTTSGVDASGARYSDISLNFSFKQWVTTLCPQYLGDYQKELCIKSMAVHEFGHALGFVDEDNTVGIANRTTGVKDKASIMNYHGNNYVNDTYYEYGELSVGDIEMIRHYYKLSGLHTNGFFIENRTSIGAYSNFGYSADTFCTAENLTGTVTAMALFGEYKLVGQLNHSPLYQNTDMQKPYYAYQRSNGYWVIDANIYDEMGTDELAISDKAGDLPWLLDWNHDIRATNSHFLKVDNDANYMYSGEYYWVDMYRGYPVYIGNKGYLFKSHDRNKWVLSKSFTESGQDILSEHLMVGLQQPWNAFIAYENYSETGELAKYDWVFNSNGYVRAKAENKGDCGELFKSEDGVTWIERNISNDIVNTYTKDNLQTTHWRLSLVDETSNIAITIDLQTGLITENVIGQQRIGFRNHMQTPAKGSQSSSQVSYIDFGHDACPENPLSPGGGGGQLPP
ncbi:MAG: hypothetical protein ACI8WB_000187 [Phenylobacterium sp.]|jgi:hypothetical protein